MKKLLFAAYLFIGAILLWFTFSTFPSNENKADMLLNLPRIPGSMSWYSLLLAVWFVYLTPVALYKIILPKLHSLGLGLSQDINMYAALSVGTFVLGILLLAIGIFMITSPANVLLSILAAALIVSGITTLIFTLIRFGATLSSFVVFFGWAIAVVLSMALDSWIAGVIIVSVFSLSAFWFFREQEKLIT